MLARLHSLFTRVADSLWALPLAISAVCAALALVALRLDPAWIDEAPWIYRGDVAQARDFAANLVGAMITLATLAFSITMVVLALAAQQLGPRLIQIFMRARGTQAALGLFMGTVVYLLLVLHSLDGGGGDEAPKLAIPIGTVLVFACVVTLLVFVHALARSIVSDHIIARVGSTLDATLKATFPETTEAQAEAPRSARAAVHLGRPGYVQRIDYAALAKAAKAHDGKVVLAYRAGAHVLDGEPHGWVTGCEPHEISDALARCVIISSEPSEAQDPEWSVRQLVEVALRALSPGINDVFTSLAVIDRLTRSLAFLIARGEAPAVWRDQDGVARVFGPAPAFAHMLDASYDQIREAGANKQRVMLRLADSLAKLATLSDGRHKEALRRHLVLVARAAKRGIEDDLERAELETRISEGMAALER